MVCGEETGESGHVAQSSCNTDIMVDSTPPKGPDAVDDIDPDSLQPCDEAELEGNLIDAGCGVGDKGGDRNLSANGTHLAAKLRGSFVDSKSDIWQHFYCVGTEQGACDVFPALPCGDLAAPTSGLVEGSGLVAVSYTHLTLPTKA